MTGKAFADYVRYRTRTTSTVFPDAEIVSYANVAMDYMAGKIEDAPSGLELMGSVEDADLLATDTSREYPFPIDILNRMKSLEINLKKYSADDDNWIRLSELDLNTYKQTTDEAKIQATFGYSEDTAFFDIYRGSVWLYCGEVFETITDGLNLWVFDYPAHITTASLADDVTDLSVDPSTITHGFPRQFHELWADSVVIKYKTTRDKPLPLTESEQLWEARLMDSLAKTKNANRDFAKEYGIPEETENDDGFEH